MRVGSANLKVITRESFVIREDEGSFNGWLWVAHNRTSINISEYDGPAWDNQNMLK